MILKLKIYDNTITDTPEAVTYSLIHAKFLAKYYTLNLIIYLLHVVWFMETEEKEIIFCDFKVEWRTVFYYATKIS